jgi:hypothetical protein
MSSDFNEIYEKAFNAKAQRRRDAKGRKKLSAFSSFNFNFAFNLKNFAPLRLCAFALNLM